MRSLIFALLVALSACEGLCFDVSTVPFPDSDAGLDADAGSDTE